MTARKYFVIGHGLLASNLTYLPFMQHFCHYVTFEFETPSKKCLTQGLINSQEDVIYGSVRVRKKAVILIFNIFSRDGVNINGV
jgi:hypothetical protein